MSLIEQQKLLYGHILRIFTYLDNEGSERPEPHYIVGKRFDKRYIYLVRNDEIRNLSNSDNSLFEIRHAERGFNNHNSSSEPHSGQVKFGEEVVFKHVNSSNFLAIAEDYSDGNRGSFKLLLASAKANIRFQLKPYRSFEKTADPVKFGSSIYIYNPKHNAYLDSETSESTVFLTGSHEKEVKWRMHFYSENINCQDEVIMDKDLVYLINSKGSGLLSLLVDESIQQREVFLHRDSIGSSTEKVVVRNFEHVVRNVPDSYPINKEPKLFNCIWLVSFEAGAGQYKQNDGIFPLGLTHLVENYKHNGTFGKLVHGFEDGEKRAGIMSGEYIKLGVTKDPENKDVKWLGEEENRANESINRTKRHLTRRVGMQAPRPANVKGLAAIRNEADAVVFQIIKLPFKIKKELYEFLEAREKITIFNNWISCNEEQAIRLQSDQQRTRRFKQTQEIFSYIKTALEGPSQERLHKQMMLFDIRFLSTLIDALKLLYRRQSDNVDDYIPELEKNKSDIAKIFSELHSILRLSCRDNPYIKEDISKTSVKDMLFLSTQGSATAGSFNQDTETLKEIFSGNKYAVENVMKPHEVERLIDNFLRGEISTQKFIRFVQIIRLLCRSADMVIPVNQRIIIKKFLQNGRHGHCNIRLKTNRRNEALVNMDGQNWFGIMELFDEKRSSSSTEQWQEFVEWIQLVSDVCLGRNLTGKYYAQTLFSPKVLQYFLDLDLEKDLALEMFNSERCRESVFRLKLHLLSYMIPLIVNIHVAVPNYPKIRFDQLYFFPDDVIKFEELCLPRPNIRTDILQSIRVFLNRYLDALKRMEEPIRVVLPNNNPKQPSSDPELADFAINFCRNLTHVMELLKRMVLHGLWSDESDILVRNKNQRDLVAKLTRILRIAEGLEGQEGINYQMSILRIINFYLDQAAQEKVGFVMKALRRRYLKEKQENVCSYAFEDESLSSGSIDFMDDQLRDNLKQSIFDLMCSEAGKDDNLFILCANTNKKLMEVRRTLYMKLKSTLVIIPELEDARIYRRIMFAREAFGVFKTKGLKTITIENQYELDLPLWDTQNDSLIGLVLELMNFMKLPYEAQDRLRIYDKLGDPDMLFEPYNETERPNRRVQKMLKESGVHLLMFYIVYDFNIRTDLDCQLYAKLLESIYYFLAVFAWQNAENKLELSAIWQQMREHAEVNCGAINALKEYFSENENLLYDENKILAVSEKITDYVSTRCSATANMYDLFYAAKLLDFFGALLTVKGAKLEQNCIRVLSFILDKARLHITKPEFLTDRRTYREMLESHQQKRDKMLHSHQDLSILRRRSSRSKLPVRLEPGMTEEEVLRLEEMIAQQRQDEEELHQRLGTLDLMLSFDGRLSYLIVLFRILAEVVEDNDINIAKCKKLHAPDLLRYVLAHSKRCWALKASVRSYINRLYYSRMETEYYDGIAETELELFIADTNDYIHTRLNIRTLGDMRIANPIKWSCPMTNLFLCMASVVESLLIITDDRKPENFMAQLCNDMRRGNVDRDDIDNVYVLIKRFLRLYERLRFIKLYFFAQEPRLRGHIQTILRRMEEKIFQFDFDNHCFINKNDKSFDYREISKRLQVGDATSSSREQKNELNEELSMCSKMLSNTDLENYFTNSEFYEKYACKSDIVLSFLDKNEKDPYLMIIDKKYKRKESVVRIVNAIVNRPLTRETPDPGFPEYYQHFLYELFRGGKLRDLEPRGLGIRKDSVKHVLETINRRISQQFTIFSSEHLTFYFRTLASNFKEMKETDHGSLIFIYQKLNASFSELIFRTVVQCNLHEQIEVAYELFYFAVTYYKLSPENRIQKDLYELIHADLKNEFLVKLDNFILFLSNDIIRTCQAEKDQQLRKSGRKPPARGGSSLYRPIVFCEQHMFFVEDAAEEYDVQTAISNQHTLDCFKSVFELLHLLCENNFVEFKKEFREQKADSLKLNNRNLLIRSTIELRKLFKVYNERIRTLPHRILDFLNEIAQIPCEANQIQLSKSTFFEDVCQFVREFDYESVRANASLAAEVSNIIEKFLKIVLSLLESNHDEIYTSFANKMDRHFFQTLLRYHQSLVADQPSTRPKLNKLKVNILLIEKQLSSKMGDRDKFLMDVRELIDSRKHDDTFKQKKNIESIEVTLQGNNHKLYFFKPEEAADIDPDQNECFAAISEGLSRETQLQKLDSLIRSLHQLELYMIYRSSLKHSRFWRFALTVNLCTIATIASLLINLILLLTTHLSIGFDSSTSRYAPLLFLLQGAQFLLGSFYCFSTLYGEVRKAMLAKHNDRSGEDSDNKIEDSDRKVELEFEKLTLQELAWVLFGENASVVAYFVISLLGLLVSPYYYCIHLFYLFGRVKMLTSVYMAVVSNLYQLLFLVFLCIAFFLVFSMLTLETYAPFASPENCESILECFLVVYNKEYFIEKSEANEANFKTLSYEIIYAVFFGSLFGNVVSGLMTDTFAQLRDEAERMEQDEQNFCYICGQSRYEIEKENSDRQKLSEIFSAHLRKHNKWSYLYYIYELKKKTNTEYTGLEYIIDEKVRKKSATWFPVKTYEEKNVQTYIHALRQIE